MTSIIPASVRSNARNIAIYLASAAAVVWLGVAIYVNWADFGTVGITDMLILALLVLAPAAVWLASTRSERLRDVLRPADVVLVCAGGVWFAHALVARWHGDYEWALGVQQVVLGGIVCALIVGVIRAVLPERIVAGRSGGFTVAAATIISVTVGAALAQSSHVFPATGPVVHPLAVSVRTDGGTGYALGYEASGKAPKRARVLFTNSYDAAVPVGVSAAAVTDSNGAAVPAEASNAPTPAGDAAPTIEAMLLARKDQLSLELYAAPEAVATVGTEMEVASGACGNSNLPNDAYRQRLSLQWSSQRSASGARLLGQQGAAVALSVRVSDLHPAAQMHVTLAPGEGRVDSRCINILRPSLLVPYQQGAVDFVANCIPVHVQVSGAGVDQGGWSDEEVQALSADSFAEDACAEQVRTLGNASSLIVLWGNNFEQRASATARCYADRLDIEAPNTHSYASVAVVEAGGVLEDIMKGNDRCTEEYLDWNSQDAFVTSPSMSNVLTEDAAPPIIVTR